MSRASQARETIKQAMMDADGVIAVSERAGVHYTQVYAFLRGGGMTNENAGRLRAAVTVDPAVWADAFAPMPDDIGAEAAP